MADNEERFLHKNIEDVRQNAELMPEMKIYNAMQKGIAEGKKRKKRWVYATSTWLVAAAVIGLFVTFSTIELPTRGAGQPSVQSARVLNSNSSNAYRTSTTLDPALESAREQDLLIPVGKYTENNGYRINMLSTVTDGRKVYIFYTVTNNSDKDVKHANFSLQFEGIQESSLHKGAQLTILPGENIIKAGQTKEFVYSNTLSPSVYYSKKATYNIVLTETSDQALLSSSNKYRTSLNVPFELDTRMLKAQEHILNIDRTFNIGGQNIKVTRVQYTPLSTYVDLEYDKTNDKEIFELISPVLISNQAGIEEKYEYFSVINYDNSDIYTDESKSTLVFSNSTEIQNSRPESIVLKTLGIRIKEKSSLRVFIDLNEEQLRGVSVSDLELLLSQSEDGGISLRQNDTNPEDDNFAYKMPETFTDFHGKVYEWASAADNFSYNFGAEAKDYPQPLMFTVEKLFNTIMDTQAVELYSN